RGYVAPSDARKEKFSTMLSMDEIRSWSGAMSVAKHQLFILDACFGGLLSTERGSTAGRASPIHIRELTTRRARQVLTAGGATQRVRDRGPYGKSVFTGQLLKALKEGYGDKDGDGFITFAELLAYIQP